MAPDQSRFECIYLRPPNGRAEDQVRRKIDVRGEKARLYVNGVEQPTLIVNDLKQGVSKGLVALWIGPGTVAHFANVRISK